MGLTLLFLPDLTASSHFTSNSVKEVIRISRILGIVFPLLKSLLTMQIQPISSKIIFIVTSMNQQKENLI